MPGKSSFELTGIAGNLTFSEKDVWMWMKLPATGFEFVDEDVKISLAHRLSYALQGLVTSEEKSFECHLIVSSAEFDAYSWAKDLKEHGDKQGAGEPWGWYLSDMYQHVYANDFREKIVLLGVKLAPRASYLSSASISPGIFDKLASYLTAAPVSDYMSDKELAHWQQIARQPRIVLESAGIGALPASAAEIAYIARKNVFPAMQSPTVDDLTFGRGERWGEGEVATLFDAEIENNPKFLKVSQETPAGKLTGYRATLSFAKFPEAIFYPQQEPWIYVASTLAFPVDFSIRFTLEPSRKVRKEIDNKLKEARDQQRNMESSGGSTNLEVASQIHQGEILEYTLKKDTTPWLYAYHRITVEGTSEEQLRDRVQKTIDLYRSFDMLLTWPTGDQLSLMKEAMPNDKVRVPAYYQRHELGILAAGVPAGSGTVGDSQTVVDNKVRGWKGPYLGHTIGVQREPVFHDAHSVIDCNNPGASSITGASGSGKTFLGLTITQQMALNGTWTIFIDPKADALALKNLEGLEDTKVIDLANGAPGMLDPFSFGTDLSKQKELAVEVIQMLTGGTMNNENITAMSNAINVIASNQRPSLAAVTTYLKNRTEPGASSLGAQLDLLKDLSFAKLCFAENVGEVLTTDKALTIISLYGLQIPAAGSPKESWSKANHLASAIMYLLTKFTKELMSHTDKSHPKAIVIDEAWAITSSQMGRDLVSSVARMGRSHNTALYLISQNVGQDLLHDGLKNSIITKFVFRADDLDEVKQALQYLDLPLSEENISTVKNLANGQCLMKDWRRRVGIVSIDRWNQSSSKAFETNPNARAQNKERN